MTSDSQPVRRRAPRAVPRLLRESPIFRRYWGAHTVSLFGDQISLLALPLVAVLSLDATAAEMGYLTAAALAPNLLFALHAGEWIESFERQLDDSGHDGSMRLWIRRRPSSE